MVNQIQFYIEQLHITLDRLPLESIFEVVQVVHEARLNERQVFVMGNGGSASTASHIVCDLAKNTRVEGVPHIRILEMSDNTAIFSAYANDEGYENAFASYLANFLRPQDVVIGISTSGNSPNVLRAIELGNQFGAQTISFTGFDGGKLRPLSELNVHVPSTWIEQVEDVHLMLGHIMCTTLRELATELSAGSLNGRIAGSFAFKNGTQPG